MNNDEIAVAGTGIGSVFEARSIALRVNLVERFGRCIGANE